MIAKLIDNSNLKWLDSRVIPQVHKDGDQWISKELILLFDDGYICRGKYVLEEGWHGYDTDMRLEHFISDPKYYIEI